MDSPINHKLLYWLASGRIFLMGLGQRLRSDDGFGSIFAEKLAADISDCGRIKPVDCGTAPENFLAPAERFSPDLILIVDTLNNGAKPGEISLLDLDQISLDGFSTHSYSPGLLAKQLQESTGAEIKFLLLTPENTAVGEKLSEITEQALEKLLILFKAAADGSGCSTAR